MAVCCKAIRSHTNTKYVVYCLAAQYIWISAHNQWSYGDSFGVHQEQQQKNSKHNEIQQNQSVLQIQFRMKIYGLVVFLCVCFFSSSTNINFMFEMSEQEHIFTYSYNMRCQRASHCNNLCGVCFLAKTWAISSSSNSIAATLFLQCYIYAPLWQNMFWIFWICTATEKREMKNVSIPTAVTRRAGFIVDKHTQQPTQYGMVRLLSLFG